MPVDLNAAINALELLPKMLKSTRDVRKLTLIEAAEQIGVNYGTLSRLERGGNTTLKNAILILRWISALA